jgi:uncharacterized metal-binding protein YceD (DUF177 family)
MYATLKNTHCDADNKHCTDLGSFVARHSRLVLLSGQFHFEILLPRQRCFQLLFTIFKHARTGLSVRNVQLTS